LRRKKKERRGGRKKKMKQPLPSILPLPLFFSVEEEKR
jgi:hypothetical protein